MKPHRPRTPLLLPLLAAACVGAGGGALAYASLSDNGGSTKTVVRQVTVHDAQPVSNESGLSVNEIYRRSYKGVVQITVSSQTPSAFGGQTQRAEGSGCTHFVISRSSGSAIDGSIVRGDGAVTIRRMNSASVLSLTDACRRPTTMSNTIRPNA